MAELLIVDDNEKLCRMLVRSFAERGINAVYATTAKNGLSLFTNLGVGVVILDIMLRNASGIDLLRTMLELNADTRIIMITGFSSVDSAITALKTGAFDYIPKPVKFEKLLSVVENARTVNNLQAQNRELRRRIASPRTEIITRNITMHTTIDRAKKLARTNIPILIQGETGTGKELLAEYIHYYSERSESKLLRVNCAAFPESLLDNELFGHDRGAYTGADRTYQGIFERADGGTLFLDELGDMPISIQTKILRTIQNMEIRRIGGKEPIKVDVRFVAAANKPLDSLVKNRRFREDLYFRLNAGILELPPLRERKEDIPELINKFLDRYKTDYEEECSITDDALNSLFAYTWPGNVRELKNVINYACAIAGGEAIQVQHFPPSIIRIQKSKNNENLMGIQERTLIISTLRRTNYNKKKAAEFLGISRQGLYNKIQRHEIIMKTVIQE